MPVASHDVCLGIIIIITTSIGGSLSSGHGGPNVGGQRHAGTGLRLDRARYASFFSTRQSAGGTTAALLRVGSETGLERQGRVAASGDTALGVGGERLSPRNSHASGIVRLRSMDGE